MLLGRLRVRGKLAVLVASPLVLVMVFASFVAVGRFNQSAAAGRTVQSVRVATQVGAVIADLQQERLISIGRLLAVAPSSDLVLASASVSDKVAGVERSLGGQLSTSIRAALDNVASLSKVRDQVLSGQAAPDAVVAQFSAVISPILSALRLADGIDATTAAGREVIALDALLRVDELNNRAAAQLVAAAGTKSPQSIIAYAGDRAAVDGILSQFTTYATQDQIALYSLVGKAFTDRIGLTFDASFAASPDETIARESPSIIYPELTSFVVLGRFVETKIAADVTAAVAARQSADLVAAYGTASLTLGMVLLIMLLSLVMARRVATPLTQLTTSAERVARIAEAELERVADDETDSPEPIRLETVQVTARDEVGDLARAFERVQATAARLVERQVQSRRNVAEMLGHIGRRTQNLVGRQISVIDGLEAEETEPGRLSELYRLDHIASRLRRNAGSLVVLSGAADSGGHFAPLPLADVARLALAEIEAYTRVDILISEMLVVSPAIINDLVLLLAELMENATSYSPPHTRVTVVATEQDPQVIITDHGIGLPAERISEENGRIAQRERLDLAPTEVLGLFVVGRLARRHGIGVVLCPTEGGGLTVRVDVARHLLESRTETVRRTQDAPPATVRGIARVPAALPPSGPPSTPEPASAQHESATPTTSGAPEFPLTVPAAGRGWGPVTFVDANGTPQRPAEPQPGSEAGAYGSGFSRNGAADDDDDSDIEDAQVIDENFASGDRQSADGPFNVAPLDHAIHMLDAAKPWNAFDLPQPALPAGPAVRGGAEPPQWPLSEAGGLDAPGLDSPTVNAPSFSSDTYVTSMFGVSRPDPPASDAPMSPASSTFVTSAPPTSAFASGVPLARRVPGATTRDEPTISMPRQARPHLDAGEARQIIEQFEHGVARALSEVEAKPGGTEES